MTASDLADFARSVAGVLERHVGCATTLADIDLAEVWRLAEDHGWLELDPIEDAPFVLVACETLGAFGCPLPLVDALVARRVLDLPGGSRPVAGDLPTGAGTVDHVADAHGATHLVTASADACTWRAHPILAATMTDGLPAPAWSRVEVGPSITSAELSPGDGARLAALLRLGPAARALGAAGRTHELALAHATTRHQFGRPVGGFGAVQQRSASCHIDLEAGRRLVAAAAEALTEATEDDADPHAAVVAAELAVEHILTAAPALQFGAHHTLAAVGYFEEHEGPWLFRRVIADVALVRARPQPYGGLAALLLEGDCSLPPLDASVEVRAFRQETERFLCDVLDRTAAEPEVCVQALAERGMFSLTWPAEHGGSGAPAWQQAVLAELVRYLRVPVDRAMSASALIGQALLDHGTSEQQRQHLPTIAAGRLAFSLGYSEPEVGSDLASLRTRAVRDGDSWVIDGQKAWTTRAHTATHLWLAARTDPEAAPRHAGITVFLVPMDTAGISVQQHRALSGEISCTVFLDGVRVSDRTRVGEVDGGWRVITSALASERVVMGGVASALHRQLDDLLAVLRADEPGPDGALRARVVRLAARVQAARALVDLAVRAGGDSRLHAGMAGVLGGEVAEELGLGAVEVLGPRALVAPDGPGGLPGTTFEESLRLSIMFVVGGGTNDVQRGLVARALGLPR